MTDDETRAAAHLLYRATLTTLRNCRTARRATIQSNDDLAMCSTPQLIDVVRDNDTLMHALALDYAKRVVVDLPPLPAKPAPRIKEFSRNLFEPSDDEE